MDRGIDAVLCADVDFIFAAGIADIGDILSIRRPYYCAFVDTRCFRKVAGDAVLCRDGPYVTTSCDGEAVTIRAEVIITGFDIVRRIDHFITADGTVIRDEDRHFILFAGLEVVDIDESSILIYDRITAERRKLDIELCVVGHLGGLL